MALVPVMSWAADKWPSKPITIIVPYSPGGATDQQARIVANNLQRSLNQSVVVDNVPGGNTVIALRKFLQSDPAYTFLMADSAIVTGPRLNDNHDYTKIKPMMIWAAAPNVLFRHPDVSADSFQHMIKNKQPVQVATPVITLPATQWIIGLSPDLIEPIPYKGVENVFAVAGGHVKHGVTSLATAWPQIDQKLVIPVMVSSDTRVASLPDVPTHRELGFKMSSTQNWWGLMALPAVDPKLQTKILEVLDAMLDNDPGIQNLKDRGISIQKRSVDQSMKIFDATR